MGSPSTRSSFTCPHCGRRGHIRKAVPAGARVRCPGCNRAFIPSSAPDPADDDGYAVVEDPGPPPPDPGPPPPDPGPPPPDSKLNIDPDDRDDPAAGQPDDLPPAGVTAVSPPPRVLFAMPPEPWYYRLLWGWGRAAFCIGLVAAGGGLAVAIVLTANFYAGLPDMQTFDVGWPGGGGGRLLTDAERGEATSRFLAGLLWYSLGVGVVVLLWLTMAAVILIGVDVARHVRRTRYVADYRAGLPSA